MLKKGYYAGKKDDEIEASIKSQGFYPIRISNGSGDNYSLHSHPETKLLAILSGSMSVRVSSEVFELNPGDQLVIPGNITHSAIVGQNGCNFFWSEKITQVHKA